MSVALLVVGIMVASFFAVLLALTLLEAVRSKAVGFRRFGWAMSLVYLVLVVVGIDSILVGSVRLGWFDGGFEAFLSAEWQILRVSALFGLGVSFFLLTRRFRRDLAASHLAMHTLTSSLPPDLVISDLNLTSRELEVVAVITGGGLSDENIASALYISPATAGTHVRNILRKARLRRRTDLLLLACRDSVDSSERP